MEISLTFLQFINAESDLLNVKYIYFEKNTFINIFNQNKFEQLNFIQLSQVILTKQNCTSNVSSQLICFNLDNSTLAKIFFTLISNIIQYNTN